MGAGADLRSVVGVLTTWFSAAAIIPELILDWGLATSQATWQTNVAQLGFVAGAIASSLVNLPDMVRMQRLMSVSAVIAGLANVSLLLDPSLTGAITARFVTGIALVGVYPPALKLMATWFQRGRRLAMGLYCPRAGACYRRDRDALASLVARGHNAGGRPPASTFVAWISVPPPLGEVDSVAGCFLLQLHRR